ncbi:MAG TPA: PQQ-binding-like beta-propeller repeat protein [Acidobacteriota bacterium]|nr:PQQ-binding-like beta-propeller repeat protein [Acidobacteriota bacterium]
MNTRRLTFSLCVLLAAALGAAALSLALAVTPESEATDQNWPRWRGPDASGVAPATDPPLEWSEDKNIRWKFDIPGRGNSTPVIWEDLIFLTTAVVTGTPADDSDSGEGQGRRRRRGVQPAPTQFILLALNRQDGTEAWRKVAYEGLPNEGHHPDGTWASGSAVTDGEVVIAHFGSQGIYAYDLKGNALWNKDLGDMRTRLGFGEGASPALHGKYLVVNWDHEGDSFIVALDKSSGEEIWRNARDEPTSWSTPVVLEVDGRHQVVVSATNRVRGYDLETGQLIWESSGMTANAIPTPVYGDGILYATSGFRGNALQAIDLSKAKGQVQGTEALLWSYDRDTPYVPSPLLYGDAIYIIKSNSGILSRLDAKTGEVEFGPERLDLQGVYASLVGAAGRIYITGREGVTLVIEHGEELKVLATNPLDDRIDASPAILGNQIFLRGYDHLYCIESSE